MMRLLADENVDRLLVTALREAGHDVAYVAEDQPGNMDVDLFRYAREQGRGLLTDDLGFGYLADLQGERPPLVILARLDRLGREARVRRVLETLNTLGESALEHLIVIEPGRVRLRPFEKN